MKNILMAISGPSGVGKGTLVKALLARRKDLIESVSCTTRAPRKVLEVLKIFIIS